jgi:hypothetical protein
VSSQKWDVRTTPSMLRAPWLIFLAVVALYLASCFHYSLRSKYPSWVWFGLWQMFTLRDIGSADLRAEAQVGEEWIDISLPALFPTQWESGYRYSRSSFRKNKGRLRVLAASACGRHEDRPKRIRLHHVRWTKALGSLERLKEREELVLDHRCSQAVKLPNGRMLP